MIAKIMKAKENIMPTLSYLYSKLEQGKGIIISSNMLSTPLSAKQLYSDFSEVITTRQRIRSIDKNFKHISVSLADRESLTDEKFSQIANHYLNEMGYSNAPNIVFRHFDTGKEHIHIVVSQVDYDKVRINDSNERKRSQALSREIEQQFGLKVTEYKQDPKINLEEINSNKYLVSNAILSLEKDEREKLVGFYPELASMDLRSENSVYQQLLGKGFDAFISRLSDSSTVDKLTKNEMIRILERQYSGSRGYQEFLNKLHAHDIYTRLVYKAGRGELIYGYQGKYFNETSLPKKYAHIHLQSYGITEKPFVPEVNQRKYIRTEVTQALNSSHDYAYFKQLLQVKGISVEEHTRNSEIVGLRFYSNYPTNPIVFKASDIDRSLSYQNVLKYISENKRNSLLKIPPKIESFEPIKQTPDLYELPVDTFLFSTTSELFNSHPELDDSLRKKKKKKKNQRNL